MRFAYFLGLLCLIPVSAWLLLQFNAAPEFDEIVFIIWRSQLTLFLLQASLLTLMIAWMARTCSWKQCLLMTVAILVCAIPFSIFVWFSTPYSLTAYFPYLLFLVYAICLYWCVRLIEKIPAIAYFKQALRVSLQIFIISTLFLYREDWYQWIA